MTFAPSCSELAPIAVVLRIMLAAAFLLSAVSKISDTTSASALATAAGFRRLASREAVVSVCVLELGLAVGLLLGLALELVLALTSAILALFTVVLWLARRRGYAGPCGCFGPLDTRVGSLQVWRNLLLVLAALFVFATARCTGIVAPLSWLSLLVGLGLTAVALVTYALIDQAIGFVNVVGDQMGVGRSE